MGKLDNHDTNKVLWVSSITTIMQFHTDGSPSIQEKYIIKI